MEQLLSNQRLKLKMKYLSSPQKLKFETHSACMCLILKL